jgi:uncharacterized protein
MDRNDRQAIESLFGKLANVERQAPPRDPEAEAYIQEQIARHPGAPYFMAQTIVVQEQALNAAQGRIEELEREVASRSGGGLLSGILGDSRRPSRPGGSVPSVGRSARAPEQPSSASLPRGAGGGFLAGAAQTAMGVAGGLLLGNMIGGMLGGDQAQAADAQADVEQPEDAGMEDAGFEDVEF